MAEPPRETAPSPDGAPHAAADSRARREREARRIQELVDFGEGRLDVPVLDAAGIAHLLRSSHRIAMIGASSNPARPSNDVFGFLRGAGYEVVPVSPTETEVDGVTAYPTLADAVAATGPF